MKEYLVEAITTGIFSGALSKDKLQDFLNDKAEGGWRFVRSIHETQKVWGIYGREAHFAIFERDVDEEPQVILLRQLLRAQGHEPEA